MSRYAQRKERLREKRRLAMARLLKNDSKKLFVCRETGETTLHKAARRAYKVAVGFNKNLFEDQNTWSDPYVVGDL